MKRKISLRVEICPLANVTARYFLRFAYVEGGCVFTDNNHGTGYDLKTAQDYAFKIRGEIKPGSLAD